MSRAAIADLTSRHPIGELLPALYADDELAQRFAAGLDTVLAPVFATLDNLSAYFQPRLAPQDFLAWLAGWLGVEIDPAWPEQARRAVVARAVELHRWRGTRRGLAAQLRLSLGVGVQIDDGGGVASSDAPGAELPPAPASSAPAATLLVRVWPLGPGEVDPDQVLAVVRSACPAHLACQVLVLPAPPSEPAG